MEVKEVKASDVPVSTPSCTQAVENASTEQLPRQVNVFETQTRRVSFEPSAHDTFVDDHSSYDVDDTASVLQDLRASAPAPPRVPRPGTGAGNHAPFEGDAGYRGGLPPIMQPRPSRPVNVPVEHVQEPQYRRDRTLDEQTVRFISSLPPLKAARVLAAIISDESPDPDMDEVALPVKRPAPRQSSDDFMSHARVAQTYHPSRLRQSLHPATDHGSQFVWM